MFQLQHKQPICLSILHEVGSYQLSVCATVPLGAKVCAMMGAAEIMVCRAMGTPTPLCPGIHFGGTCSQVAGMVLGETISTEETGCGCPRQLI